MAKEEENGLTSSKIEYHYAIKLARKKIIR